MKTKSRKSKLPVKPDQITLILLTRALAFQAHAISHITLNTPVDRMVAIHGLDNSVEHLLRILLEYFDIESKVNKTLDTLELSGLAGEVNAFLRSYYNFQLPYLSDIKRLRQVRNLVQHAALDPIGDLKRYQTIVERFSATVLDRIFGITKDNLHISSLILDDDTRNHLSRAERLLENNPLLSIVASRDAFENALYKALPQSGARWDALPATLRAEKDSYWVAQFMEIVSDQLILTNLGVDLKRHARYQEYMHHIPSEYCADKPGYSIMQRPWSTEDAMFCYQFAADNVLKWQNEEFKPLYPITWDKKYSSVTHIAGIELAHEDSTAFISFEGDEEIESYIVSSDVVNKLNTLATDRTYVKSTDHLEDGVLTSKLTLQIHINTLSKRLLTNNPPRWQVGIWYEQVPLTWRRIDFKDGVKIAESPCINTADTKAIMEINENVFDEASAQAIIRFRTQSGDIRSLEDLKEIKELTTDQVHWIARCSRAVP
jgi:hypothetical protein